MSRRKELESEFQRLTSGDVIGRVLEWHDELPSTNERALTLARENSPEGTMVIADAQTEGKGTMGRNWYSPPGGGLWVSIVLYPTQSMAQIPLLTIMAAEVIKSYLYDEFKISAVVKKPNDLLVRGKKICGILAEAATTAGSSHVDYVILGFGLNLKLDFPDELEKTATSLADHVSTPLPPRTAQLARLAACFEERYLI